MNRALTPQDVLRLRFVRDARISPDGRTVAYALSYSDESGESDRFEIRLQDIGTGSERRVAHGNFVGYPRWSCDGRELAYVKAENGRAALAILSVPDGTPRIIEVSDAVIAGPPAWSPDGRKIAVVLETRDTEDGECRRIVARHFRSDGVGFTAGISQRLCLIKLADGAITTLVQENGFYSNLEWDEEGKRILFIRTSTPLQLESRHELCSIQVDDRSISEHISEGWFISAAKWTPDGRRIVVVGAYRSRVPVPTTDLWVLDRESGEVSCQSHDMKGRIGFRFHHDMPLWDLGSYGVTVRDADCAWVTVQDGGRAEIWEMSLSDPVRCTKVIGGDRCCVILNAATGEDRFIFLATDMLNPVDLHLFDANCEKRLTQINRDVLAEWPTIAQQPFRIRSSDGLELDGWFLSQSPRSDPLPTVMFIHGGPYTAVGHAFRFDFHLLASHGIGVVFANFRGSFGYGEEFALRIVGDVGARGFPDHMAAVDRAIELGLADPKRTGVWGASHGGFATCWIVGHTDRFRTAVAEAAITDLTLAYYLGDIPDYRSFDLGGKPHEIPDVYRSRSPIVYAHRCKTPTLMIHGEQDFRCPIAGAEQFHRVLLDVGCVSEMVRLRSASHLGDSIGPPATRVAQNAALLDWFTRFL